MTSWESLGGGFNSGPGVCSWAPGRLDVFGQGLDAACWHKWFEGGWSGWESLGGGFSSELDAVSWDSGRIDVFGRGLDNACWHKWFDGGWSGWESLGGGFNSGTGACSWAPGRLDVFGRGLDNACWHKWFDGGWSGWESLGGGFNSGIAAVSWSSGRIDVFGRGLDNACWHKWFDGGWSDWESLGGGFQSGFGVSSWGPGRLDVFGQGLDGACWHKWFDGGWSGWESLGGGFNSGMAAVSWSSGRIDVFGRGLDNACWHAWHDGGAWADWSAPAAVPEAAWGTLRLPVFDVIRLRAIELPIFDRAAGDALKSGQRADVVAKDAVHWRTLSGWLDPPADGATATVLCRKTGLSIRIAAKGAGTAKLLPFATGSPAAALSYTTGTGPSRQETLVPMEAAVDVENATMMLLLPFSDPTAYGEMVNVLSDTASGIKLVTQFGHRFLVQEPGPPQPGRPGGVVIAQPHRRLDDDLVINSRVLNKRLLRTKERPPFVPLNDPPEEMSLRLNKPLVLGLAGMIPNVSVIEAIKKPAVFNALRLAGRDWGRVVLEPEPPKPGQPKTTEATAESSFEFPVFRPMTDLAVYPDQPRVEQEGWGQVPGRGSDQPPLHFKDSPRADVFFILPTHFKLGFYRGADPAGADDLPPFRVTQYLDDANRYRVAVSLVAIPFIADADREALGTHIREVVLQQMLPFVSLEPRAGLKAAFVSQFSAGAGDDRQVLPETIRFSTEEVLPDRRLALRFDMEAMHYGIFCELLRKGIRGRVVLSEDGVQESIDVQLRLDDLVTNAVAVESEGFGTPQGPGAEPAAEPEPPKRTLRLRNGLKFPARLSALRVTCIDRGRVPGMVFDAERLDLLAAEQLLAPRDDPAASASYEVRPQRIAVWNDTVVSMGTVRVDAGTPQEWLDRVAEDPSLQPQRHAVKVVPVTPTGAQVQLVRLKLFLDGDPAARVERDILPSGPAELTIELRLAELAAAGARAPSFVLEYDCLYADGSLSLPQRIGLSPTVQELPVPVLAESPTSVYRVEHNVADGPTTTVDGLDRAAAATLVEELRTRGERWRVFARRA